jgi:hypothetical protein
MATTSDNAANAMPPGHNAANALPDHKHVVPHHIPLNGGP